MTVLEPGKFDISDSFFEQGKATLHVLARINRPKAATAKKGAPAPAETATRGEFNSDVLALLGGVYNVDLDPAKLKEETKKLNKYKHMTFEGNAKVVQVYLYPAVKSATKPPYEIALVFEYPKTEAANLVPKIELTLESFETGARAQRLYSGAGLEEEAGEAGAGGGNVVF
jgi:hypothetical protein